MITVVARASEMRPRASVPIHIVHAAGGASSLWCSRRHRQVGVSLRVYRPDEEEWWPDSNPAERRFL